MASSNPVTRGNGEVDLRELIAGLWGQRVLIVSATILAAVMAVTYAFLKTPVYQGQVGILPPRPSDITGFNVGRGNRELPAYKVQDVYAVFTRTLTSGAERRAFFRDVYLPSLPKGSRLIAEDQLWARFQKVLSVKSPDKSQPDRYEVHVEHADPSIAADWANLFVKRVEQRAFSDMRENALGEAGALVRVLEKRIAILKSTAVQRRQDKIEQLREGLAVAEAAGQETPLITTLNSTSGGQIAATLDGSLTYMRGARALRAELEILRSRKSDDPFISELRPLQEKLNFYQAIDVAPENVSVFTLDSAAEVPETPIKPNKPLIIVLGVVLGAMGGVFIALVRLVLRRC